MAKRDKSLYRQLRTAGVRKSAARTAAEAAKREDESGRRVLSAIAQELHEAGDALDARAREADASHANPDGKLREAARKTAAGKV